MKQIRFTPAKLREKNAIHECGEWWNVSEHFTNDLPDAVAIQSVRVRADGESVDARWIQRSQIIEERTI